MGVVKWIPCTNTLTQLNTLQVFSSSTERETVPPSAARSPEPTRPRREDLWDTTRSATDLHVWTPVKSQQIPSHGYSHRTAVTLCTWGQSSGLRQQWSRDPGLWDTEESFRWRHEDTNAGEALLVLLTRGLHFLSRDMTHRLIKVDYGHMWFTPGKPQGKAEHEVNKVRHGWLAVFQRIQQHMNWGKHRHDYNIIVQVKHI